MRLTAVNRAAAAEGLAVGMTLADARARVPAVSMRRADPAADMALLERLAEAARRYTPSVALSLPDGLDLDLTGCATLFGGEAALLEDLRRRVARIGLSLRLAVADTPALAYAVARFGAGGLVEAGARETALAALPVAALRLTAEGCAVLQQLGLKRIGQILDLPRPALARRLGAAALERLDEAIGRRACPLTLKLEPAAFRAERRLFEPISEIEPILAVTEDLAADLVAQLETRALGGRRFRLELFRVDGAVRRLEVGASLSLRAPGRIVALFAERLAGLNEGLEADFGFDQLRLSAQETQGLSHAPRDLLQPTQDSREALAQFADRLAARFGARIRRLRALDAHGPERAAGFAPLGEAAASAPPPAFDDAPLRPLRLFRPPQPIEVTAAEIPEGPPARFAWRRVSRTIVRAEGPERIAPEWGQPNPERLDHKVTDPEDLERDYYRIEDQTGLRYWVFRQGRHGQPGEPRWYIHGLFG